MQHDNIAAAAAAKDFIVKKDFAVAVSVAVAVVVVAAAAATTMIECTTTYRTKTSMNACMHACMYASIHHHGDDRIVSYRIDRCVE